MGQNDVQPRGPVPATSSLGVQSLRALVAGARNKLDDNRRGDPFRSYVWAKSGEISAIPAAVLQPWSTADIINGPWHFLPESEWNLIILLNRAHRADVSNGSIDGSFVQIGPSPSH